MRLELQRSEKLYIPICGNEMVHPSLYSAAECIASRVVDIIRTDVSWTGGVTDVMKTAHLAEAFGVQCEIHTSIYHPLEVVNLHCCSDISNCEFFELLYPLSAMAAGTNEPPQNRRSGLCASTVGGRHRCRF